MIDKFKQLIDQAERILITSHISPDPDSISSLLLTGTTLEANFPDKQIVMTAEELLSDLKFLSGYDQIVRQPLEAAVNSHNPDLVIIVDANNFNRCTRGNGDEIAGKLQAAGAKVAIIDHHEPVEVAQNNAYINRSNPAAVQDVYETFFYALKLKKPAGFAQTTMLGIYSDSGGFIYENKQHRQTFKIVDELLEAGVNLEELVNRLHNYSAISVRTLGELAKNLGEYKGFSFSYVGDEFIQQYSADSDGFEDIRTAIGLFANDFIRNIDDRQWGFVVSKDIRGGDNLYSVSFRAISNAKDISIIAKQMGGGGHKPAAGAKFQASSVKEAVEKVKAVIESEG
jgi:phosphoesterase RecJ-like protein